VLVWGGVRFRAPLADRHACTMDRKRQTDPVLAASSRTEWTAVRMYKFANSDRIATTTDCPLTVEGDGRLTAIGRVLGRKQAGRVAATLERSAG